MSVWYGIWYGGPGYASFDPESELESFGSIQGARDALYDRFHEGSSPNRFNYVNRDPESVLTPAVSEDSCIHLFATPHMDYPDRQVFFGPRGGVRVECC